MLDRPPNHEKYEKPWLIQRLNLPYPPKEGDNPLAKLTNVFAFGGGLPNGGLSGDAMEILNKCFSFDYMGAAEFEYGIVPVVMSFMFENREKYELVEIPVTTEKGTESIVYAIVPTVFKRVIIGFIIREAFKARFGELKEVTGLHPALEKEKYRERLGGWLELNNGYFFFTDKTMFENVAELFDLAHKEIA